MATEHLTRAELGRALGLEAGDVPLPVVARSLTRQEVRARDGRTIMWLVIGYVLIAVATIAVLLLADTRPLAVRWLPLGFAVAAFAVAIAAWLSLRGNWSYQDPGTTVEVGESGVTVSDSAGTRSYDYDPLAVARIITRAPRNSVYFDGIELETPDGNLVIGDDGFARGNAAAGAILCRYEAREAERVAARP